MKGFSVNFSLKQNFQKRNRFKRKEIEEERKREIIIREELAQFAVKEEEMGRRKLRNIIENIAEPIIITDVLGKINQINKATKNLLGYSQLELFGKELFFIKEEEKPKFREMIKNVFEKKPIENVELTILTKNKKEIPVLISVGLITDLKERPIETLITMRDISKLKEVEENLKEIKDVLEIKVTARTLELKELAERLEEEVKRKTLELQKKITELERFQKLAVGRELKMIELKKEIKKLKEELEKRQTQQ